MIFEKALDEPKYSSMYAQLCKRLSEEAPNFEPPESPCTFRLLLLNRCKLEFENRTVALEQHGHPKSVEEEERRQLAKRKMLGNIKFIGELGKLEILSEAILHRCIQELLQSRKGDDPSEDLECLCQIMRTCGRILDSDKGKALMNQYFERMGSLAENQDLQPRIRFMLKDVIDLRHNGWVPRKAAVVEGPMPFHQIRSVDDDRLSSSRFVFKLKVENMLLFSSMYVIEVETVILTAMIDLCRNYSDITCQPEAALMICLWALI